MTSMNDLILSKDNAKVKQVGKLKQKKYRDQYRRSLVEGSRAIKQLIDHQILPSMILFDEDAKNSSKELSALYDQHSAISYIVRSSIFANISDTVNSQGVLAVFEQPDFDLQKILSQENCRAILLDKIQDPGNLGTIIRTADSAGFDLILYTRGTTDIFSEKVNRSAMGANFYLPILPLAIEDLPMLKENGLRIISTMLDEKATDYRRIDYGKKFVLVFGNEANGIRPEIAECSDHKAYIPIYGKAESLNVAVAAGIVIYRSLENSGK